MTRGQRVIVANDTHGTHQGVVAVLSSNERSVGVLLDEPFRVDITDGMALIGALLVVKQDNSLYMDFFGDEWTITETKE